MLKVLYIFTSASAKPGSVQNKVLAQIKAMNEAGINCSGLFFSTDEEIEIANPNIQFVKVARVKPGYFRSARQRSAYNRKLYDFLAKYEQPFDFIYCRYPGANLYLAKLTKRLSKKIFFEHVTAETFEIKLYRKENPIQNNLSSWLSQIEFYYLPLYKEWLYGKQIRRNTLFGICNSEQIALYERKCAGGDYSTIIQGDAVNVSLFKVKQTPALENTFRMIFLKGASTSADFNGLDRLFAGMRDYHGTYNLKLFLFGNNLDSEIKMIDSYGIRSMVSMGKFITKEEADIVFDDIHVGVAALAVHRKGINETTTIKSREYFARGLPFIFGHQDPDLSGQPGAERFILEFPADDSPVDMEKVIQWYRELAEKKDIAIQMRTFALNTLDYNVKMKKLAAHLNILKNK